MSNPVPTSSKKPIKKDQTVLEKVIELAGPEAADGMEDSKRKEVSLQFEGLIAYIIFMGQLRILKIKEISKMIPERATRRDQSSFCERLKERYDINLKFPKSNLVVGQEKKDGKLKFYPMELVFLTAKSNFEIMNCKGSQEKALSETTVATPSPISPAVSISSATAVNSQTLSVDQSVILAAASPTITPATAPYFSSLNQRPKVFFDPSKNRPEDIPRLLEALPINAVLFYPFAMHYIQKPDFAGVVDEAWMNREATLRVGRPAVRIGEPLIGCKGGTFLAKELYVIQRFEGGEVRKEILNITPDHLRALTQKSLDTSHHGEKKRDQSTRSKNY